MAALDQVDAWLESPTLMLLAEPPIDLPTLRPLLRVDGLPGRRSMMRGLPHCAVSTASASRGRRIGTLAAHRRHASFETALRASLG